MNETLSFSLVVPYVTPTRALEVCHIMDIEYYIVVILNWNMNLLPEWFLATFSCHPIQIRIKTPNFYPDFKLCMDVLIGNVPITGVDTVVANPAEASIQTPNTLRPLSNAAQNDEGS